jgi:FkbM family methyltransferase
VRNHFLKRFSRQLRARFWARILVRHGVAIVAETKNGLLAVQPGDFNVSRSLLADGDYDWPQIMWLSRLAEDSSRMIFVGAHIGAVLVPVVRSASKRQVIAYEPSPRNFRLLAMNLRLNKLDGVTARNTALGERAGKIQFTENHINTGNSRVARSDGEISVDIETLDDTLPADWNSVDLIVMDIEGSEVAAMRGAHATLAKTRFLYVEFAPDQLHEQGSSAAEFAEIAEKYFKSAYIFGCPILFFGPGKFAQHLRALEHSRGLLLNVLFTQDSEPNPQRMINPLPSTVS